MKDLREHYRNLSAPERKQQRKLWKKFNDILRETVNEAPLDEQCIQLFVGPTWTESELGVAVEMLKQLDGAPLLKLWCRIMGESKTDELRQRLISLLPHVTPRILYNVNSLKDNFAAAHGVAKLDSRYAPSEH